MGKKIHIFEKNNNNLGFRAHIVTFQDNILFCLKIEDIPIWLKSFQSYLHNSVIILASESLWRPKQQDFSENFPKKSLRTFLPGALQLLNKNKASKVPF